MNEINVVCYARVSSLSQDLELQISEIKKFCDYRNYKIIRVYSDKISGKNTTDRPEFQEMMDLISKKNTLDVKAVVVHQLDRLGRSLSDLIKTVEFLKSKNIDLIVIADNIDTQTNQGVLFFQLIGAISEFEQN